MSDSEIEILLDGELEALFKGNLSLRRILSEFG